MNKMVYTPQVTGSIFRVRPSSYYTLEDSDGDGSRSFTIIVHNVSGDWVSVDIDRSSGVFTTGHIAKNDTNSLTELLQLYVNHQNKLTRWRPGFAGIPGNGGGEIFFNIPQDAFDVYLEIDVVG